MKIKIKHDVYNISNRIKIIDKNYYLVYDTSSAKFEVHHSKQVGESFCLTLPYYALDARTLDYTLKSETKNLQNILQEIEEQNAQVERQEKSKTLHLFNSSIENLLKRR